MDNTKSSTGRQGKRLGHEPHKHELKSGEVAGRQTVQSHTSAGMASIRKMIRTTGVQRTAGNPHTEHVNPEQKSEIGMSHCCHQPRTALPSCQFLTVGEKKKILQRATLNARRCSTFGRS